MSIQIFRDGFLDRLGYFIAAVVLAIFVTIVWKIGKADGRSDYCYVHEEIGGVMTLNAHVPWRFDRTIYRYVAHSENPSEIAKQFNCELH